MELTKIFQELEKWKRGEEMLEALHEWADANGYTNLSGFSISKFKNGQKYRFKFETENIEFYYDSHTQSPYKIVYSSIHENLRDPVSWEILFSYFKEAQKYRITD